MDAGSGARAASFDRRGKHIALAAHCLKQLRFAALIAQPLTQAADLNVNCPVVGLGFAAVNHFGQLISIEYPIGMIKQDAQQAIFAARKRGRHAIGRVENARSRTIELRKSEWRQAEQPPLDLSGPTPPTILGGDHEGEALGPDSAA